MGCHSLKGVFLLLLNLLRRLWMQLLVVLLELVQCHVVKPRSVRLSIVVTLVEICASLRLMLTPKVSYILVRLLCWVMWRWGIRPRWKYYVANRVSGLLNAGWCWWLWLFKHKSILLWRTRPWLCL